MIDFEQIYQELPEAYDALVSFEDYQGNIMRTIQAICPLDGLTVVELGAGTGRLTRLTAPYLRWILACDGSAAMLRVARQRLRAESPPVWNLVQADNRKLPVQEAAADLVLAGWSLGHAVEWAPDGWRRIIEESLSEMRRVLRPGGMLLILETLGTGRESPEPPSEGLARYYELLERSHGFQRRWARTDYSFETPDQGAKNLRFFFGEELATRVLRDRLTVLPECTGFWAWHA